MSPRLSIVSGPHAGETIEIQRGKLLVGREEDCQLRPDSEFVSRHHCVILLDEYTLRVRDLGSKNGTFVNGHRIGPGERILLHGDMVAIGEMMCQVDLNAPVPIPAAEGASPGTNLHGTGIFEGDTVQAATPPADSPPPTESHPAVPAAVPFARPAQSSSAAETRTSPPPGA
jgi:predicted component of type VI protein secretion system